METVAGHDRSGEVEALRRKLSRMSQARDVEVLPVPEPLAQLLSRGGLVRGSVVGVTGAWTVPLAMIAEASRQGASVALVGLPEVNLAAAVDLGADLDRIAAVPGVGVAGSGADAIEVAGVLLDGIDLVVVDPGGAVRPSRAKVLAGRARKQSSTLLVAGRWPGASLRIHSQVAGYQHFPVRRSGSGRIGGIELDVQLSGASALAPSARFELVAAAFGDCGDGVHAGRTRLRRVEATAATMRPGLAVAN